MLSQRIKELTRHSAIYGLGSLIPRIIAVLLLPVYTRYLTKQDYGAIETLLVLSQVLSVVLRLGLTSAFFRFWFDYPEGEERVVVVRTAFWFTMVSATFGLLCGLLLAPQISHLLFGTGERTTLVRVAFVAFWAQMNYDQLVSVFRVEQRSVAFLAATLGNFAVTVGATIALVVAAQKHAVGAVVGNFTGTLTVYLVLLAYRRYQLGFQFDWKLFREMNRFGLPLVPSALALWVTNFSDRIFLGKLAALGEVGLYSVGVRVASAIPLVMTAFRTAWPAFAYSIEDDSEARRTYAFVMTYLVYVLSWLALTLSLLSPWIVRVLTHPAFYSASRVVAPLAFGGVAFAGYLVVAIGVSRARRTQFNWVVTGAAAVLNVALNLILIPPYGMMGAAIATAAAYTLMFVGMTINSQRHYRVPYQWRRVTTAAGVAVAIVSVAKAVHVPLAVAVLLVLAYPLALAPFGFYLPAERARLRRFVPSLR